MSRRGFTLLEVMVALAILASAVLALSEIVSSSLRNHVRARNLEVATLLARGKMAEIEDQYEAKGFRTTDESDEGTFEADGHPEVRWRLELSIPSTELSPDAVLRILTGSDLTQLFPSPTSGQASPLGPFQAQMQAALQNVLTRFGERMKAGVREARLTVSWPEGAAEEGFTVTTHLVVLLPAGVPQ
jgi:general secretion pathway protein I